VNVQFTLSSSSIEFTIRDGRISSLVDLDSGRQLIAEGKTGGFVIFEDMPNYWSVSLLTVQLH
jgi:alpha-mannosidase